MAENHLYHQAIVERARAGSGAGRLPEPHGSHRVDNPLCGDRVTVDICLREGKVSAVGHEVRGCLLCEAAASVIGQEAVGESPSMLQTLAGQVQTMLEKEVVPKNIWHDLEMFRPVSRYPSRHLCVLLPFQALRGALDDADNA